MYKAKSEAEDTVLTLERTIDSLAKENRRRVLEKEEECAHRQVLLGRIIHSLFLMYEILINYKHYSIIILK